MTGHARLKIILDAGHGGTDPGACLIQGKTLIATEREENLEMVLTIKHVLGIRAGIVPVLTRTSAALPGGTDRTAPSLTTFRARTSGMGACDAYVSVHFDTFNARKAGGVYFSGDRVQRPASQLLARELVNACGGWIEPDTVSNHGRLYIRDARTACAVLWEVGPINQLSREQRIERADKFCRALCEHFGVKYDATKPV